MVDKTKTKAPKAQGNKPAEKKTADKNPIEKKIDNNKAAAQSASKKVEQSVQKPQATKSGQPKDQIQPKDLTKVKVKKTSKGSKGLRKKGENKANHPLITIKQIGSPIRRDPRQALYLKSLGLGKMNRERKIVDNPSTRGLIDKLSHMVVVLEK